MTGTGRELATFEFEGNGRRMGIPVVNGHPLATVTEFTVHADARALTEVKLTLLAADAVKLNLTGVVTVDDETREALVSLGWTPPGKGGQ